ncbi:hypothetical protein BRAO375_4600003 [Bradyrhizobium sp. ORS 375]|uniref:hypothetical protein n=1 Tax=Bradyrhizobium sp. (strain ORS 375) TaxID=566679 RepID=UPI0002407542|nr:hypothetical protein [Bradyrhizobium sp. ORS 375]CCD95690.1 hypothetical protein BRAO375_4600003 [Bradyrhizobium sp. ORS 375]
MSWSDPGRFSDRQRPWALIVHFGLGVIGPAAAQSCACFEPSVNPHDERLLGFDAMSSECRAQLLPPPFGEETRMADVFAAAIYPVGAKREAQVKLLAMTSDVLDGQGIVVVRPSLGAPVLSQQVNPRSKYAVLEGAESLAFVHGSGVLGARCFCGHP